MIERPGMREVPDQACASGTDPRDRQAAAGEALKSRRSRLPRIGLWRQRAAQHMRSVTQCPDTVSQELDLRHAAQLLALFPLLGALFSTAIVLFSVWDFWRDAANAGIALMIRCVLVGIGTLAYLPYSVMVTPLNRCGFLFVTHISALILAQYVLQDGFLYGFAGITSCLFVVSVLTLRPKAFFAIVTVPTVLVVALTWRKLALADMINQLMLYAFALGLAFILMLVVRSFALQTMVLEERLLKLARRDALTGTYNRGYLFELAEGAVALARRHHRPLAVAMLDIDHFKAVNDQYGHGVGDSVIVSLAQICLGELRTIDHFGRIGGEEFVWIMPETDTAQAMLCAERLRAQIEKARVATSKGPIGFTVSIGVAILDPRNGGWKAVLHAADCALYRAKDGGRNRVALAQ